MAVVERKRKKGSMFYAVNEWRGKQVAEKVGPRKREAEIRDRAMKAEIKAGTYQPPATSIAHAETFRQFAEPWLAQRTNAYAPDERRLVRLHIYTRAWLADCRLDEWKHADTDRLVEEMRKATKPDGSRRLSDKTIANLLGVASMIFDAAVRLDRCVKNPIALEPRKLKRRPAKEKEIYSAAEIAVLTRHVRIPWPIRVLNALCLFSGMREGEACGRRWHDLLDAKPLPAMHVHDQYDGRPLKTERSRMVPIHPELAPILKAWAEEGFELYTGIKPSPEDFIVPNVSRRAKKRNHTRSSYYKAFVKYAEAAEVRPRSLHSTRHTFISLCMDGGANEPDLEKVTHNAAGTMINRYSHKVWNPLCEAVLCLRLDVHPGLHPSSGNPGDSNGRATLFLPDSSQESAKAEQPRGVQFPAPPPSDRHKTSATGKSRQGRRQEFAPTLGEFKAGLAEDNRRRKRKFLSLREADPGAAAPALALTRGLDAAYAGDGAAALKEIAKAGQGLGLVSAETAAAVARRAR